MNDIKNNHKLTDFYLSREYEGLAKPNSESENHLRVGVKLKYDRNEVLNILRDFDFNIEEIDHSPEWDEIEDMKALATATLIISDEKINKTGKLAHFFHHYSNISRLNDSINNRSIVQEGRRMFRKDIERYRDITDYLRDGLQFLVELYNQWLVAQNKQQT